MGKHRGAESGLEIHDNLTDEPTLQEIARLDAVLRTLVDALLDDKRLSAKRSDRSISAPSDKAKRGKKA